MFDMFKGLEFIGPDFRWISKVTWDEEADYEYGYDCAYRYSEAIRQEALNQTSKSLMQANEIFRASIGSDTAAGRGFQSAIIGH